MSMQPDLFNQPVAIPSRAPSEMRPRLSRQCEELLAMLRRGDMTNRQLASVALNYTARLSEVRAWLKDDGLTIAPIHHNRETGEVTYAIQELR